MNAAARQACLLGLALCLAGTCGADEAFVAVPGGAFQSVIASAPDGPPARLAEFRMLVTPVTNAQFLEFVRQHPEWQRDRVASLFADTSYLSHWVGPTRLGEQAPTDSPVVHVSWFAASAYCESVGARLPSWDEWEFAAAADETRADARTDPAFRRRMLTWYAQTNDQPGPVGSSPPNVYGVQDMHASVWEWVLDFNALLVSNDSRSQGEDPDLLKYCGSGALTMQDKENYAVLMRIAMLSSLQAHYTTANLGFRCARDRNPR